MDPLLVTFGGERSRICVHMDTNLKRFSNGIENQQKKQKKKRNFMNKLMKGVQSHFSQGCPVGGAFIILKCLECMFLKKKLRKKGHFPFKRGKRKQTIWSAPATHISYIPQAVESAG